MLKLFHNLPSFEYLNRRYGPWVALALGIIGVVYMRRGLGFAPVAVGLLMLAWIGAEALRRLAPDASPINSLESVPRWRRLILPAAGSVVSGLWQDVLFYLLPLWWASAVLSSWNVAFPLALTGMALFSCFEDHWRDWVLKRPIVHAAWSAVVLFATLVPATALLDVPLRIALAVSAALASLAITITVWPRLNLAPTERRLVAVTITATAAILLSWSAPTLPPVPVVRIASGTGTAVQNRSLIGATDAFPEGTRQVYAWFAIAAPAGYRQKVRVEWHHEGALAGRALETEVIGGRPEGFRTWAAHTAPAAGRWQVELRTDSSQLVARESFTVR